MRGGGPVSRGSRLALRMEVGTPEFPAISSCQSVTIQGMIRSSACHLSQHRLQGAHQPQGSLQTLTQDHPRREALGFIDCLRFEVGIGGVALNPNRK